METPRLEQTGEQHTASDPYNFTEAMKNMPSFEQHLAQDNSHRFDNIEQRYNINSETVRHYIDDRRQENYNTINETGKSFLADVYKTLVQEYPELSNIKILDQNIKSNAYFNPTTTLTDGQIIPSVNFNFSHTETYLKLEELKEGDNFGLEYVLKTIALKTGARPPEIMHNERLVSAFVMLHEFGHALDFRNNYLNVELANLDGLGKGIRALPVALNKKNESRLKDLMTQPIPGQVSADKYLEKVVPFANRLTALGINPHDPQDVINSSKKGYREMSSEAFADNFATEYIMRHYNNFFEDANTSTNSSEKVKTHIGDFMRINSSLDMLGLSSGKAIKLTKVEVSKNQQNLAEIRPADNPPKTREGFLSEKITIGQGIDLLKEGDPSSENRYTKSPDVKNVYIRPRKDEHGAIKNDIVLQLHKQNAKGQDGFAYYLVELTGEEPKEVNVSPEEITNQLELQTGSKVMLMKRELSSDSNVHLGNIMGGKLERPDYFRSNDPLPIQIGHGIHLASTAGERTGVSDLTDPNFMSGGNTTAVNRIYRKWKSYFIETDTSTYEVIPYL